MIRVGGQIDTASVAGDKAIDTASGVRRAGVVHACGEGQPRDETHEEPPCRMLAKPRCHHE